MVMDSIAAQAASFDTKGCVPPLSLPNDEVYVWADRKILRRAMQNLLSNAIRYGLGEVQITVEQDPTPMIMVANRVLNPETLDLNRIWERFYTKDAPRSEAAGLGLPIVKLLAQKMNASVYAELKGDIFSVRPGKQQADRQL